MNNFNSKAIIKRYKFCLLDILIANIVIAVVIYILTDSYLIYGLSLIVLFFLFEIFKARLYNKFFNSVLGKEMNLPKYIDLIETGEVVSNSLLEHLYIAYYSGDYKKAISICQIKLEDKKCKNYSQYYLLYLARCYFETGDLENLSIINEMFKGFVIGHASGSKMKEKLIYFKFVDLYLSGDISAAKELYEKLYLEQKEKPSIVKLDDISIKFTYAICCYECGDFEKAIKLFDDIIAFVPSFYYAKISKRYLDAIEKNTEYIPEPVVLDEGTANIPTPKSRKKIKIIFAIGLSLILIGTIGLAILSAMAPKQPVHFKGIDYYSTKSDVRSIYGNPDEIREHNSFEDQYYDFYNVEYLGVNGDLLFIYYMNSNTLHRSQFIIDSSKFSSYKEYEAAVNTTYKHFAEELSKYRCEDKLNEDGLHIIWYNDKGGYSYSVFESKLISSEEQNDIREYAVFEFLKLNE